MSIYRVILAAVSLVALTGQAEAADWMFRSSYYSHADSPGYTEGIAPRSRSAYRPAYLNPGLQFSIQGGTRYNNYILRNGSSFDRTLIREDWFQIAPPTP